MHSVPDAHILPGGTANRGAVQRIGNAVHDLSARIASPSVTCSGCAAYLPVPDWAAHYPLEQVEQALQAGAAPGAIKTIGTL
jgi:hypothetical protein